MLYLEEKINLNPKKHTSLVMDKLIFKRANICQ